MENDPLAQGLIYEAKLPFQWCALEDIPDIAEQLQINESNEAVLQAINVLEEFHHPDLADEYGVVAQELNRIDAKVNLMLDLLSQLLTQQKLLPGHCPVRFGAEGLAWRTSEVGEIQSGQHLAVDVYMQPRYPSPLKLTGDVVSIEAGEDGVWITIAYHGLTPSLHNAFDKLIFRHHRRSVAMAKGDK